MKRRILPEAAYDFWAEDSRDGERKPIRHLLEDARKDAQTWRRTLKTWQRCCITVKWSVNERKVLGLINGLLSVSRVGR